MKKDRGRTRYLGIPLGRTRKREIRDLIIKATAKAKPKEKVDGTGTP